jgi:anaerobic magnesium-protoporphyrin IX monomethyl ester cyclase
MSFKRAIVVNPPNPAGFVSNKDSMGGFGQLFPVGAPPFPPLDIPYVAASLAASGCDVTVIDAVAMGFPVEAFIETLDAKGANRDAAIFIRTSLPTIDFDLSVCREIRRRINPAALVVFGPVAEPLLHVIQKEPTVDFVLTGEAELSAAALCRGDLPASIAGLAYREGTAWRRGSSPHYEVSLDRLPFPRWDLMPHERYVIPRSSNAGVMKFLPMLTSRGCPYGCSYCPYPVGQGLKWRYRSAENVADEMEHLVEKFGVEYILFRDPMFSLNQPRVVSLCREIKRRGISVEWRCETRVDCLDEATIDAMAEAGCTGINFGVESTDPQIQRGVHRKPILADEFVRKTEMCERRGIRTFAFFVIGLPGDTVETILSSIEFAVALRTSWTQFTVATPFVGTKLHQWAVDRGLISPDAYAIISSHQGSIGNENLSAAEMNRLYRFAQFLQSNLINRRGVLKNGNRGDLPYRFAKRIADEVGHVAAVAMTSVGRPYFQRALARSPRAAA